jgi:type VI secretion system secreted protein Hcp
METAAYLRLSGSAQGEIKGGSQRRGREGAIEIVDFRHQVALPKAGLDVPRTPDVVHEPVELVKEVDCSTPKLYRALSAREPLESVTMEWFRYTSAGQEELYFSIYLGNARLVLLETFMPESRGYGEHMRFVERIRIAYETIRWSWGDQGTIEFETDWHGYQGTGGS